MKKLNVLFGLIIVLLFTAPVATAKVSPACCSWNPWKGTCMGYCEEGLNCIQTGGKTCNCTTPTSTTSTTTSSTSSTTTTLPETCDECCISKGYTAGGSCHLDSCPNGTVNEVDCNQYCGGGEGLCCCIREVPSVPEFVTPAIALAILLTSPAFAYLLLRRRH